MSILKCAVVQMRVTKDPYENFRHAAELIHEAAQTKADAVILPEMFHIPYDLGAMRESAILVPGTETEKLSAIARQEKILLCAGTIAEKVVTPEKTLYYNTALIFAPNGDLIGTYRKNHLFDVNLKNKIAFQESAVLSPGNKLLLVHYKGWKIAPLICYDVRFPELFRLLVDEGADFIVLPAAFSKPTGALHWDITLRTRAVDNQIFLAAASPARNPENAFTPWGHSLFTDPFGKILNEAGTDESLIYAELDSDLLIKYRTELPLLKHRRQDCYKVLNHMLVQHVCCPEI